jgi:hypothetical protein
MQTVQAERLARSLMDEHGLWDWTFKFSTRLRTTMGYCEAPTRTIGMSQQYVEANTKTVVRSVILHEIAHALVGDNMGHGPEFQAKAIEIGGDPSAKLDASDVAVPNFGGPSEATVKRHVKSTGHTLTKEPGGTYTLDKAPGSFSFGTSNDPQPCPVHGLTLQDVEEYIRARYSLSL